MIKLILKIIVITLIALIVAVFFGFPRIAGIHPTDWTDIELILNRNPIHFINPESISPVDGDIISVWLATEAKARIIFIFSIWFISITFLIVRSKRNEQVRKRSLEITLISIFVIILGGWSLFRTFFKAPYMLFHFSETVGYIGLRNTVSYIYCWLASICFLISGVAFFLLKKWSKVLIHLFLLIEILLRLFHVTLYQYTSFTTDKLLVTPKIAHSYFIILAEVIILYAITRPKVKKQFK